MVRETEAPAQWERVAGTADGSIDICEELAYECRGWGPLRLKLKTGWAARNDREFVYEGVGSGGDV